MSKLNVNCSCLLISSAFDIGVMLYLECDACSVFTTDFKIVTFSQRAHWSRVIDNIDMKSVCNSYREITEMEKTIDSKTFIKFIIGYALLRFQAMVYFTVQRFVPKHRRFHLFSTMRTRPSAIWTIVATKQK